jgi:hypothetical protein
MKLSEQTAESFYHQLYPSVTLAQNERSLHQTGMSDAAFSQRRQGLPMCLFEQIAATGLRPIADTVAHPEALGCRDEQRTQEVE